MSREKHQKGVQAYVAGCVEEALRLVGESLAENETSEAWNDWAVMQGATKHPQEAEEGYRRALELDPTFLQAQSNLGLLCWELGRTSEALDWLEDYAAKSGGKVGQQVAAALADCRAKEKGRPKNPDRETMRNYLRQFAVTDTNDLKYFDSHLPRFLATLDFLPPAASPRMRALELGTASHYMTPALKRWKGYEQVRCADIWEGEAQCTRRVVSRDGGEEHVFTVDNFDLQSPHWPYDEEGFDLVLLCEILEHLVADPMNVMAGINRVLKVGGQLLLTVPNIAAGKGVEAILRGESPYIYGKYQPGGRPTDRHNREYAPQEIVRLAAAAGFRLERLRTFNSWWQHGKELAWLAAGGFPVAFRGDTIFYLGRKEGGVRERYPEEFYELTGTQEQRRQSKAASPQQEAAAEYSPEPGRPRVLVIHEILPEYDRSGSEQRHWQVLRALRARGCAVTYIARHAVNKDRYLTALREIGITVYAHDKERLAYQGISAPRDWALEEVLKEGRFDAAFLLQWFWSGISVAEQYLDDIRRLSPSTRIVAVCDDPHGPRELALARLTGKAIDWERARDYEQREREIYGRADLVVTVSEVNRRNLLEMGPEWDIEILPNEAESMIEPGPRRDFAACKDLLFLGDFSNFANRDGLEWFLAEVWPRVRARLPGVHLHLAGSNLPQGFAAAVEGVNCLGFVPSLKETFDAHRVFISPARYGISTRTKNLNALGQAIPLVTTTVGAEGLFLTHEKNALLADSPEDFAEAVCRAYTDARLWKSLSEQGPLHLRETFSLARLGTALGAILDRALATIPREYEPDHLWSVRRIEQRFPQLLAPAAHENLLLVRTLCYLRTALEFLDRGEHARALEQLRHPFSFIYGEVPRNVIFARLFLALDRCYAELHDTESSLRSRAEARLCLLPPATSAVKEPVRAAAILRKGRPRFSVTIPTFNRCATLEKCLASFAQQTISAKEFEVVVVDDGSSDGTEEFCEAFHPQYSFQYFRQANSGAGAARRKTIEHARGEYVLLCNDDTIASPDLLAEHERAHQRHAREKIAVLGDFRYPPEAVDRALTCYLSWHPFLFPQVSLQPGLHAKNAYFVGCNLSLRRDAVLAAGSFDPQFRVAEDTELGVRLRRDGFRVLFAPEAQATHLHLAFPMASLIRRAEIYGRTQWLLLRKHPQLLGDGSGPFGRLDEAARQKMVAYVQRHKPEVQAAVNSLEKFETLDFLPFFARNSGERTAGEEVMDLFDQAVPVIFWFHLFGNFLQAWDEESAGVGLAGTSAAPHARDARL